MKKRIFFLAVGLLMLTITSFGQNGKKYYKAGTEFVEGLKYEDAVVQFTSAIGAEPMNTDYYYARGQVYESLSKLPEAKADYEKLLVFSPKNVDALIRLGVVTNQLGDPKESLRILNRAWEYDKRNPKIQPERVITLVALGMYDQALGASDSAIVIKDSPMDYYWRGIIYTRLNNEPLAKKEYEKAISKDKKLPEPRIALAELLLSKDLKEAMYQCNEVLKLNDRNTDAYIMRSKVYMKSLDPANALNDMSKCILIDPKNPDFYLRRGDIYQELTQHANAINDYSKYISLRENDPKGYYARAGSYEATDIEKAIGDYAKITLLAKYDVKAQELLDGANTRLYELKREKVAPEIALLSPSPVKNSIEVRGDKNEILISGKISDKSKVKSFSIDGKEVQLVGDAGSYEFITSVDVTSKNKITFIAKDDYNNEKVLDFPLARTEITPPVIKIMAPYASEDGQIFIDRTQPRIFIEGKVEDASRIKAIYIDNNIATYERDPSNRELSASLNPGFSASIDITNKTKLTVIAEDIYGNINESVYMINREGAGIASTNPMGKTWVVFIENSGYQKFGALDGPIRDISTIRRELENYQVHRFIHKKDMTKKQLEMFFNIELRDEIRTNQVKSIMIWYAGHGRYINDVGYWIPVDAERDQEFTYFNINFLKAGIMGYENDIVHTLVVSDACESGPGFYSAMRAITEPTCEDSMKSGSKSAQVFSSVGYLLASDNSRFAASFADALRDPTKQCIPIETIVRRVTPVVEAEKGQKPKFGTIQGLKDMEGTFFFIKK